MTAVWAQCDCCHVGSDTDPGPYLASLVEFRGPDGGDERLTSLCVRCHALPYAEIVARWTEWWSTAENCYERAEPAEEV